MYIQKRKVTAAEDIEQMGAPAAEEEGVDETLPGDVNVEPEASELLFEAEDVAELVAEVTGEPVEVTVEEDAVTFSVGDTDYKIEPEGNEEILESRKIPAGKSKVAASTGRVVRRVGKK